MAQRPAGHAPFVDEAHVRLVNLGPVGCFIYPKKDD